MTETAIVLFAGLPLALLAVDLGRTLLGRAPRTPRAPATGE